jgi:hypothetical protein
MRKTLKWATLAASGLGAGVLLGKQERSEMAESLVGLAKTFLPFPLNVPIVRRGLHRLGTHLSEKALARKATS